MTNTNELAAAARTATTLDSLAEALNAIPVDHEAWNDLDTTSLPVFGGEDASDLAITGGVWSWDATRLLTNPGSVDAGGNRWQIVSRADLD